jgi:arabinofuranosyltransferase
MKIRNLFSKKSDLFFCLIVAAYILYAAIFIFKTSFIVEGQRYYVLFDDAMISMRYAQNLAAGNGPVWNAGSQPVEGYTNPLWVAFMALFHLFPIPPATISLCIQVSGVVFMVAALFLIRKIADNLSGSSLVALLAVILTAFYAPLNNWVLLGMEVSLLILIICVAVWLAMEILRRERFSPWLYVLLGIGTLVRIDMAVPYLVILSFLVLTDRPRRRQHLLWGVGLLLVFVGGQTLIRWLYYGDILPNTYYLKMSGYPILNRILRGAYVLFQFAWDFNWLLFLFPLVVLLFRRERPVWLLFLLLLGQIAYSVYVGGDAWEHKGGSNRYIAIVMPLFFILFAWAADFVRQALVAILIKSGRQDAGGVTVHSDPAYAGFIQKLSLVAMVILVLLSMVNMNYLKGDFRSLERWALLRQPMFVEGNKEAVQIALDLKKITIPNASVGVVAAGTIPYFSERFAIDLLGKSDVRIAHMQAQGGRGLRSIVDFRPGHMKWDYDYSIGELKPDVIVQLWGDTKEAKKYLEKNYTGGGAGSLNAAGDALYYSLRNDSPNIIWERVTPMP